MYRKKFVNILIILTVPLTFFYSKIFGARRYYIAAFIFCVLCVGAVLSGFENSKPNSLKMAIIAVMCAIGVAGRRVFAPVPFFKPVAAVAILCGAGLGAQAGFLCGAMIMLVSNFMFGQGPWTVWQMLAFGLIGYFAGLIFYRRKNFQQPVAMSIYGFLFYVFATGPILDLSGIFGFSMGNKVSLYATLLAGLPVNIIGGIATFIFLIILGKPTLKKLDRLTKKYNLS